MVTVLVHPLQPPMQYSHVSFPVNNSWSWSNKSEAKPFHTHVPCLSQCSVFFLFIFLSCVLACLPVFHVPPSLLGTTVTGSMFTRVSVCHLMVSHQDNSYVLSTLFVNTPFHVFFCPLIVTLPFKILGTFHPVILDISLHMVKPTPSPCTHHSCTHHFSCISFLVCFSTPEFT